MQALLANAVVRQVTVTGPGGTGKTRLALHLAAEVLDAFPDGTYFVELAAVHEAALVPWAIAAALGVTESPGMPLLEGLKRQIAQRRLLLVMDNFEHVLDAASTVGALLAACPRLKVLATSREALRISGEREFPLAPLGLPDLAAPAAAGQGGGPHSGPGQEAPVPETLGLCDSVVLFVERALAVRPDFALTAETAPLVAETCIRLDGLPLAIELAVARLKVLTLPELNRRLAEGPLGLLTGGARDLPARQRTLRAAIDWSYALLDPGEQALHRRLAVFAGGATLESVEAVCNAAGTLPVPPVLPALQIDVLDGLSALVEKSLVQQREYAGGRSRYAMLQTIRDYALEQLEATGEAGALRQRHLEHFLALARARPTAGDAYPAWYARLEEEADNLRAALGWAHAQGGPVGALGLALAGALADYWRHRSRLQEGRRWLTAALESGRAAPPDVRMWALHGAGLLAHLQGDNTAARAWWEEGLTLARAAGDRQAMAWLLNGLAGAARSQGDYAAARAHWGESLALCQEIGIATGCAHALTGLAAVAHRLGELDDAIARYEESLAILRAARLDLDTALVLRDLGAVALARGDLALAQARWEEALNLSLRADYREGAAAALLRLGHLRVLRGQDAAAGRKMIEEGLAMHTAAGNRWEMATGFAFLGAASLAAGDLALARALFERSLALCRELGRQSGTARALAGLGHVALEEGALPHAAASLKEALTIRRASGDRVGLAEALEGLACLAATQGGAADALRLVGAAAGLRDALRARPTPPATERVRRALAAVGQQNGHASELERAGREMSLEEACEAALALPDGAGAADTPGRDGAARRRAGAPNGASQAPASTPGAAAGARGEPVWPAAPHLTPREREVALLLARGHSSREIAAELVVAEKTVATHVDRILGKLGVQRRGQVAAWVAEHVTGPVRQAASA